MNQELIHKAICQNYSSLQQWFSAQSSDLKFLFYSSFDIRDADYKVVPVDANVFPAGFNNICQTDKENASELITKYLHEHYHDVNKNIALLCEEHTKNAYYWENVWTIRSLLEEAGYEVRVAIPRQIDAPIEVESSSGRKFQVYGTQKVKDRILIQGDEPELIICNNDFSQAHPDWADDVSTPMSPPYHLGWHRRKKSDFFRTYNDLAYQFAEIIKIDPWHFQVKTELFSEFDVSDESMPEKLAGKVDQLLEDIKVSYENHGIDQTPFIFIKNNAGTYGLGVTQVQSGEDVRQWNYKTRKKMKAMKGGGKISEVILQEGIFSQVRSDEGSSAEPSIYMLGSRLAGGFLRVHRKKGPHESLNSPGAVYQRLCVSDLEVDIEDCPMENVYGWISKMGVLATAREAKNHPR